MRTKILLSLLTLLCTLLNSFSQPVTHKQRSIGGNADDLFSCMSLTSDGGLIAGGTSYSGISGNKTDSLRGITGGDYWIVKLNDVGQIQWDKTYGGTSDDQLTAIRQTTDGGYILGGYSQSDASGDKKSPRIGAVDYWLIKIDNNGVVQWEKTYGKPSDGYYDICRLYDLKQTQDGGYIMTGIAVGDVYESPNWVIKTDAAGIIQWDLITGGEEAGSNTIIQTKEGGYLLGTSTIDHVDEKYSYHAVKIDNNGVIQWNKIYGTGLYTISRLSCVLQLPDNSYLLAGSSDGYAEEFKTDISRGAEDYWLLKIDSTGNALWDKTIGGNYYDYLKTAITTSDQGLLLGGYSYSNASGEKTEDNRGGGGFTDADYWTVKLNKDGAVEWDKTIGGDTTDILFTVKERRRNEYVTGGYSYSGISGNKTKPSRGGSDYWLVGLEYLNSVSAVSKTDINAHNSIKPGNSSFVVYPNPARDILYIQNRGINNFILSDQSGKALLIKTINSNGEINVAHLPAGLYYLKSSNTGIIQKIIIIK